MKRYIEGEERSQATLLPECLDDFIAQDNTVRVVDAFIGELDMVALGFAGANPACTGRPSYHPCVMLKVYLYGYLNKIPSSRRLERECQRNVELMWLTGRLAPDFKTIADFRRDNSEGIRNVCRRFVVLCRDLKLFSQALVAIDGSKFKAVNSRDCNFTNRKIDKGLLQPALEIGKIIRIKGFATAVQDTICSSACALVWLAGEPRMMSNRTAIGFHVPYTTDSKGKPVSDATHGAMVGSYLTGLGFSPKVVMFVVTAGADDLHLLSKGAADRLGIAVTFTTAAQRKRAYAAYAEGLQASTGVGQDMGVAAQLYRQSAVLGFAGAQNNLGDLYETGEGVPRNDKAAIYWYTRAAERGEPTAYLSLSSLLAEGTADKEVFVEALKYALLAKNFLREGSNKAAAELQSKTLKAKLAEADIERAVELATRWMPLYQEEHLLSDPKK